MLLSRQARALAHRFALVVVTAAAASTLPAQSISAVDPGGEVALSSTPAAIRAANIARLDVAMSPYRRTYSRLTTSQRRAIDDAFTALLPGDRFTRYRLNETQARAIAYLAFGAAPCHLPSGGSVCATSAERVSDDALWIRDAVVPLRRAVRVRLTHDSETRVLAEITERAREIVRVSSRCNECRAVRERADLLLTLSRDALDRHRVSAQPAWQGVGEERLARLQSLAAEVEREAMRCR